MKELLNFMREFFDIRQNYGGVKPVPKTKKPNMVPPSQKTKGINMNRCKSKNCENTEIKNGYCLTCRLNHKMFKEDADKARENPEVSNIDISNNFAV
ncbi:unnamed protein product, partial [marine sediment metagenome]